MVKKYLKSLIAKCINEVELVKIKETDWKDTKKEIPNKDGYYLVTMRCKFRNCYDYIVCTSHYSTKTGWMLNNDTITAWMELPSPYKGGEEE